MATSREKILERRTKLERERLKEEAKLKALKEKWKATQAEILKTEKQEEAERQVVIGKIFSERMKTDEALKNWVYETVASQGNSREKTLFNLPVQENQ